MKQNSHHVFEYLPELVKNRIETRIIKNILKKMKTTETR